MELLDVCLCCFKSIQPTVPRNNSSIEHCCKDCKKEQTKLRADIKNKSLKIIEQNPRINRLFDSVYYSEDEAINYVIEPKSKAYKGSIELRKYMFSLLEEIHKFSYEACFECIMYADLFNKDAKEFFSERFFQRNAVSKVIGSWEKIIRFHALYFGVEFMENKKKNSLANLSKKLNKTEFIKTDTYRLLYSLKSKGLFKSIDETRKIFDHRLSYEAGGRISDFTEIMVMITEHCENLYKCLENCLELYQKKIPLVSEKYINDFQFKIPETNEKLYKKKALRIKKGANLADLELFQTKSINYVHKFQYRLKEAQSWKHKYSAPPIELLYYRLFEVSVRMHESARSLAQMVDMYTVGGKKYTDPDEYFLYFQGMNYRYFLLSSLLRIYSAYDKISFVIQDLFEVKPKRKTFEGTVEYIRLREAFLTGLPPMKICNRILSHTAFKKIYKSRQDHFHLLTPQYFVSTNYKEVMDFEVCQAIIENSKLVYELIESVDQSLLNIHYLALAKNKR